MQLIADVPETSFSPCVATIGFFDGVHRGHRYLLTQVREQAELHGYASAIVTFGTHPRQVIDPNFHPALLTTTDEKVSLLESAGIDRCFLLDFTPELARLSAQEFMRLLRQRYNIRVLVVGYDHRFGHRREEGFEDYVRYGKQLDLEVVLAKAYRDGEEAVSSSAIRLMLNEGRVSDAASLLGYDYFLGGTVVGGRQIGRKLGYPTANIAPEPYKIIPAVGVYAVRVWVRGQVYGGMLSVGYRPTLNNGADMSIEVHIFDFQSDIYGEHIRVDFVHYLRPEWKFETVEELVEQLHKDAEETHRYL